MQRVLADPRVWAVSEHVTPRQLQRLTPASISALRLEGREFSVRVFFGRADLQSEPVVRPDAEGLQVDFGPSQVVQYVPSMMDGDTVLEGHLAILRHADYARIGVSARPISRWFTALARSLEQSIGNSGAKLVTVSPGRAPAPTRGHTLVSPGVAALSRAGMRLKQFVDSRIEFSVTE